MEIENGVHDKKDSNLTKKCKQLKLYALQLVKSPEEKRAEQLKKRAVAAAIRRANETPEQTAERRRKNRERQRRSRVATLKKSLAVHTGLEQTGSTKIVPAIEGSNPGTTDEKDGQPYICIACKASYDSPMEYFDHIQQECLKVYLEQPEVFSKILTFVKSKMKEIRQTEQSSKAERGTIGKQCSMCGKDFTAFTASTLRWTESLCLTCRKLRPRLTLKSTTRVSNDCKRIPEIMKQKPDNCDKISSSRISLCDLNATSRSSIGDSNSDQKQTRNCDLMEGAVPPKRPLLTCETLLPSYVWPKQIPSSVKTVRIQYSKNEPYKMHHCWECDSPILPTSKRFIEHFKMIYECQWCIYTTHCHQASVDHVMRLHACEEAKEEPRETVDFQQISLGECDEKQETQIPEFNAEEPRIKLEPPESDEPFLPGYDAQGSNTDEESMTVSRLSENCSEEIGPTPPVNLRCLEISPTTLILQWDPPPVGRVTNYIILFQGTGAPTQQVVPPERTVVRLAGLTPDTLYVIRVYTACFDALSQYAIIFRKTGDVDESTYASRVLQPLATSCLTLPSSQDENNLIFGNFSSYLHDERPSHARQNCLNAEHSLKAVPRVSIKAEANEES